MSILKQPFSNIGLDVSKSGIRLAQFRGSSLVRAARSEIPISIRKGPDAKFQEFVSTTVSALIKEGNFEGKCISSVLRGPDEVGVLFFTLPEMDGNGLKDAVGAEIKKRANFSTENSVYDYDCRRTQELGAPAPLRIISAVSPLNVINQKIAILEKANLLALRFDITGHTIEDLLESTSMMDDAEASLFLDVGACVTTMNFFTGNLFQFAREISIGCDDLISAIAKPVTTSKGKLDLSLEDAELLKDKYGIVKGDSELGELPAPQLSAMMRPFVERLLREINNSISHFSKQFNVKVGKIFLYNGAAKLKGLDEILRESLNIEIKTFNPFEKLTVQLSTDRSGCFENSKSDFVVAAGLALGGRRRFNILPTQMKLVHKLSAVRMGITVGLLLLAVTLFLSCLIVHIRVKGYRVLLQKNKSYLAPFKERLTSIDELGRWKGLVGEKEGLISRFERQPLWHGVLKEISNIVPEGIVLESIRLASPQDNEMSLDIKGHLVLEEIAFSEFLIRLDNSSFFENVALISRKEERGRISFELRCGLIY